jgi:hypothetical protein
MGITETAVPGGLQSPTPIEPRPTVRTLQIEEHGDPWKGLVKPKIRLMGCWLERAGFRPGHRVQVICVSPGLIELRSLDALIEGVEKQPHQSSPTLRADES